MTICTLIGFNNYYNRRFKKRDSLSGYEADADSYILFEDINFNPNDQISTSQIINWDYEGENGDPDYLLVVDPEDDSVISRWFVMEMVRTRKGQYRLDLRRDVLADNIDTILQAPIFVQKAFIPDNDSFIYNDEGMNTNKIKKSETLLMDETKTPWIVGYMDPKKAKTIDLTFTTPKQSITMSQLASRTGIPESTLSDLFSGSPGMAMFGKWSYCFSVLDANATDTGVEGYLDQECQNNAGSHEYFEITWYPTRLLRSFNMRRDVFVEPDNVSAAWKVMAPALIAQPTIKATMLQLVGADANTITEAQFNALSSVSNPIFYAGEYYSFRISKEATNLKFPPKYLVADNPVMAAALAAVTDTTGITIERKFPDTAEFRVAGRFATFTITLEKYTTNKIAGNIGGPGRKKLRTRPYQMFCMPFYDLGIYEENPNPSSFTALQEVASLVAGALEQMGDIYDIQLLPYCPMRAAIKSNRVMTLVGLGENLDYDYIIEDPDGVPEKVGIVFYPEEDSDSFIISQSFDIDTSKKYDSNCKMLRICSPNYQGSFDFNVAKNDGVSSFIAQWTYKPFTPFIRVAPSFGGLYGQEFNDQRGLICGGDFSLMRISDKWYEYQLNNKNYQNIFNREIQSMDLSQSIQMRDQRISAAVGTIQGGVAGAQTGAMIGGGWGAAAGAVLGTAASGIGGAIDVNTLAKMQKDQRSLAIDKFNYQLGNIKALPDTITKIDAFDISSKKWPFVEEYGPTDEEKAAFLSKIEFDGMTIMRIGKMSDYVHDGETHYFKGELIRDENLFDDYHVMQEISAELLKGVYI